MLPVSSRPLSSPLASSTQDTAPVNAPRALATPDKPGQPNTAYDGHLIGGDGNAYPPGTKLTDIPPTKPQGKEGKGTLIFVNGIGEDRGGNKNHIQEIANGTGMNVVGIYNATQGSLKDLVQCLKDKKDLGTNHAVDTLADTLYAKLKAGESVRVLGHSQGALITQRALVDVKNRLMLEDGMSKPDAEKLMGKIGVETMGGAGSNFPDGPKYVHYVNRADIVPMGFGVGAPGSNAGKDAKVVKFGWPNPFGDFFGGHSTSTYFKHYQGFPA